MTSEKDHLSSNRDSAYWDRRFGSGDTPWELNAPSSVLIDALSLLFPGEEAPLQGLTALLPGCGTGSDALELARQGARVLAVDWSDYACSQLRERIAARRAQGGLVDISVAKADFFAVPAEPVDLVCEHTFFCAIDPVMRREYVAAVSRWLRPGGYLVGNFFVLGEAECRALPDLSLAKDGLGPPFATSVKELAVLLSGGFDLLTLQPAKTGEESRRSGLEWVAIFRRR